MQDTYFDRNTTEKTDNGFSLEKENEQEICYLRFDLKVGISLI